MPMMAMLFFVTLIGITDAPDNTNKAAIELEQKWKKGEIKDAVEAIIYLEKAKHPLVSTSPFREHKVTLIVVGLILILLSAFILVLKYYPIFNFCWGDYLNQFEKIEGQRKIIIWVIIFGLIISVVGGIIANAIGGIKIF